MPDCCTPPQVLYNMMSVFAGMEAQGRAITHEHVLLGCGSFLTVAFGGLAIGAGGGSMYIMSCTLAIVGIVGCILELFFYLFLFVFGGIWNIYKGTYRSSKCHIICVFILAKLW